LALLDVYRRRYDLALAQIDRALQINPSDADNYRTRAAILTFAGRASEALPWIEATLRFDHSNASAIMDLCITDYMLGRYVEAVAACDRAAARNSGRLHQTLIHPFLAATYAELGRSQDAEDERAATTRISPFFDPERFAAQFGTQDARDRTLAGLRKAGFR
jgi:adenylate cyclase